MSPFYIEKKAYLSYYILKELIHMGLFGKKDTKEVYDLDASMEDRYEISSEEVEKVIYEFVEYPYVGHIFDRQQKKRRAQKSQGYVCKHARDARPEIPATYVAEVIRVYRNGLCPAEANEHQHNEPDDIEVRKGIKRVSAADARRVVARFYGGKRVRKLMKRQRYHQYKEYRRVL